MRSKASPPRTKDLLTRPPAAAIPRTKNGMYPGCLAHVVSGMLYSVAADRRQPKPLYGVHLFLLSTELESSGGRPFLALSAAWHARGSASTLRRKHEPRPRSVAQALGLTTRRILASAYRKAFRPARANRTMETPHFFFCFLVPLGRRCGTVSCVCDHTVPRPLYNEAIAEQQQQSHIKLFLS